MIADTDGDFKVITVIEPLYCLRSTLSVALHGTLLSDNNMTVH